MLSRRRFLAATAGLAGISLAPRLVWAGAGADGFTVLRATGGTAPLLGDKGDPTAIWGYEGQCPGPTLRVRQGEELKVRLVNRLLEEQVVAPDPRVRRAMHLALDRHALVEVVKDTTPTLVAALFLTAVAGDGISGADVLLEQGCRLSKNLVPRLVTITVVLSTFFFITQNLISFSRFFKHIFGLCISRIFIRMIFFS
mgnify:CR=1 FL=1